MDGIVPLRGSFAAPREADGAGPSRRRWPSRHLRPINPAAVKIAVRLPAGHAAAVLAGPGGGRAAGDRASIWALRQPASTRPGPRSRSSPPSSTRSSRRWSRTRSAATTRHPGALRPQPDRAAQEQGAGRAGRRQPAIARRSPLRRPGAGADPQRPPGRARSARRTCSSSCSRARTRPGPRSCWRPCSTSSRSWPRTRTSTRSTRPRSTPRDGSAELKKDLAELDEAITEQLKTVRIIGPGGKNIFEEQYINLGNTLAQKQMRIGELNQQLMIAQIVPQGRLRLGRAGRGSSGSRMLEAEKKKLGTCAREGQADGPALRQRPGRQRVRPAARRDPRRARRAAGR